MELIYIPFPSGYSTREDEIEPIPANKIETPNIAILVKYRNFDDLENPNLNITPMMAKYK